MGAVAQLFAFKNFKKNFKIKEVTFRLNYTIRSMHTCILEEILFRVFLQMLRFVFFHEVVGRSLTAFPT